MEAPPVEVGEALRLVNKAIATLLCPWSSRRLLGATRARDAWIPRDACRRVRSLLVADLASAFDARVLQPHAWGWWGVSSGESEDPTTLAWTFQAGGTYELWARQFPEATDTYCNAYAVSPAPAKEGYLPISVKIAGSLRSGWWTPTGKWKVLSDKPSLTFCVWFDGKQYALVATEGGSTFKFYIGMESPEPCYS
eukprot:TRINITY_DN1793_c0_g1_i8.p1 TRINITY_DN1793_c0_g1~~TRINITY_DN1793_c0_g1_i8.p1  ORF type:complete len:195 (+),score=33.72 TRINITY_DN1793_c0_g1_i8:85-669(+)